MSEFHPDTLDLMTFENLLNTNPETLPGVPTNEELRQVEIERDPLVKKMERPYTEGERQGFLEMWRIKFVRNVIESLEMGELANLYIQAQSELEDPEFPSRRAPDVRFIASATSLALGAKRYQMEEE